MEKLENLAEQVVEGGSQDPVCPQLALNQFCSDNTSVVTELTSKSQNNLTECFEEARMAVAVHNKTSSWLEENEKFFLPPVCNKMMHNDQLKVALAD